ncbi:hypothetical protein CW751_14735 [Brumimicrobium salinarum]|uniref:Grasp-with-spasm system SPASM domain peptide maturase n=1 Tax=Brumimicrobium salinarum TaxID=2058658 RepID=A0A2I0QZH5_9FLAO|nr:hypothetical protein [Brumimicrobium salinarum]PKR79520.1 hypothetical protein CW751_14735 [Brumimicrobium salinarum]
MLLDLIYNKIFRLHQEIDIIETSQGMYLFDREKTIIYDFPFKSVHLKTYINSSKTISNLYDKCTILELYQFLFYLDELKIGTFISERVNKRLSTQKFEIDDINITIIEIEFTEEIFNNHNLIDYINASTNITLLFIIKLKDIVRLLDCQMKINKRFNVLIIDKNLNSGNDYFLKLLGSSKEIALVFYDNQSNYQCLKKHINQKRLVNMSDNEYRFSFSKKEYENSKNISLYYHGRIFINKQLLISNSFNSNLFFSSLKDLFPVKKEIFRKSFWWITKDQIIDCKNCLLKNYCIINNMPKNKGVNSYILSKPCKHKITSIQ